MMHVLGWHPLIYLCLLTGKDELYMYEIRFFTQLCIQNNPNEARNMLLQNPQLAYALLQAQIVMKIVDPQVALVNLFKFSSKKKIEVLFPCTYI